MANKNYDREYLQKAIIRWRGYDNRSQLVARDMHEFAVFIGYPHNPHGSVHSKIVDTENPDVQRLIDLINGPNGNTILKMLKVKNDEKAGFGDSDG